MSTVIEMSAVVEERFAKTAEDVYHHWMDRLCYVGGSIANSLDKLGMPVAYVDDSDGGNRALSLLFGWDIFPLIADDDEVVGFAKQFVELMKPLTSEFDPVNYTPTIEVDSVNSRLVWVSYAIAEAVDEYLKRVKPEWVTALAKQ